MSARYLTRRRRRPSLTRRRPPSPSTRASPPAFTGAQATALTLDTSVAAGGVGGLSASLRLVSITQGTKSWLGVDASGINLSLSVDPLTLSLSNGELRLNRATGAAKLDWATLNVTTGSLQLPHLDVTGATDLHVAGTATIALAGLFTATGTGSLDVGQVSDAAASPAFTGAQATALTLDTSVAAGGVGGLSASLRLVSITQGTKSWLGVDASGISLSLSVDPLTLSLSNGELRLNRAAGAAKLDWATLNVTTGSLQLPRLNVGAATDLHVAGTATIALAGLFTATGTGSLDVGQVSDAAASAAFTGAQATALTLDTSVAAGGVGALSASLKLVSITQGTKSWLGVDASGINLSLSVDPLTLSLSNGELRLNRAAGAAKLDWATLNMTPGSLPLPRLAVGASTDLHVAGTATIALAGLFTATGTGSLDVGQVSDAAASPAFTSAQATALTLDPSVTAGGVGGASASLKLVSIK